MKLINNSIRFIKKSNIYIKLIIILLIVYCIVHVCNLNKNNIEGFIQKEKFIIKEGQEVFDDFYVNIYDQLTYEPVKNKFELGEIVLLTKMNPKRARVLDIGSGTGNHLRTFAHNKVNCKGLELSKSMIQKSKEKYPHINVIHGDALNTMVFPGSSFTHITCLSMTIYYIQDKKRFFDNCFHWLVPGGYLSIHLVNKDKFNPILRSANPLLLISPQKYAKERITVSNIKFTDMSYKRDFKYNKDKPISYFHEDIKDTNTKKVRKNNHILYMDSQKDILSKAKNSGFILKDTVDLVNCQHEYEYIYILYKPE